MSKPNYSLSRGERSVAEGFIKKKKHIVRDFRHIRCKKKTVFCDVADGSIA